MTFGRPPGRGYSPEIKQTKIKSLELSAPSGEELKFELIIDHAYIMKHP